MRLNTGIITILVLAVFLLNSNAFGLSFMGPPTKQVEPAKGAIGFDYSYSKYDIKTKTSGMDTIEDLEQNRYLGRFSYGLRNNYNAYFLLGLSDADDDNRGFSSGTDTAWGFGVQYSLKEDDVLEWGILGQVLWVDTDGSGTGGNYVYKATDIQIAFGPEYKVTDSLSVYGGPFLHLIRGHYWAGPNKYIIKEDSIYGGYVGVQVDLTKNFFMAGEASLTGAGYAWGVNAGWKF